MESCLVGSPTTLTMKNVLAARPTAQYHPSVWGDTFLSYVPDDAAVSEWKEKAETLKTEVRKMLVGEDHDIYLPNNKRISAYLLHLIDAIQRLGVAYHFEREIDAILAHIFVTTCYHGGQSHVDVYDDEDDEDLVTMALRFRLLRQNGYNLTCDVFIKFMDDNGNFHKSLCDDVDGLLGLYEAAHLRVNGEALLDDALSFTTSSLRSMLPSLSPSLAKQVHDALYRPLLKRLPRLEARNYMSIYEQNEKHNKALLHFAKLDFNILQKLHQKELSIISKWWKDLNCEIKFPFARDRVVEGYFWVLGVYFEPEYSVARVFLGKVIGLTSIVDDMYDGYCFKEELELFTEAVERGWDASTTIDLPECMKVWYQELLNIYQTAEQELVKQGRSTYGLKCSKETMKGLLRAYMEERKWLYTQHIPTLQEYMKVALVSCGYTMLPTLSFVFMGDSANEEAFDWLLNQPKILHASSVICRLMDDIVSHKEREHPPSAVECYTTQYGLSEEEACQVFRAEVDEAWKDVNEAILRPTPVDMSILMRVVNFTRVIDLLYKESDGYTHVTPAVKEYITSLLRNVVQV